jgi:hypothetical protein
VVRFRLALRELLPDLGREPCVLLGVRCVHEHEATHFPRELRVVDAHQKPGIRVRDHHVRWSFRRRGQERVQLTTDALRISRLPARLAPHEACPVIRAHPGELREFGLDLGPGPRSLVVQPRFQDDRRRAPSGAVDVRRSVVELDKASGCREIAVRPANGNLSYDEAGDQAEDDQTDGRDADADCDTLEQRSCVHQLRSLRMVARDHGTSFTRR